MTSSGLNIDIMVQKGNIHILIYYPIVPHRRIKVYRHKTTDMVILHWKNVVIGIYNTTF